VGPLAAIFAVATLVAAIGWFVATRTGNGRDREVGQGRTTSLGCEVCWQVQAWWRVEDASL
jgi:hypothetical protein